MLGRGDVAVQLAPRACPGRQGQVFVPHDQEVVSRIAKLALGERSGGDVLQADRPTNPVTLQVREPARP